MKKNHHRDNSADDTNGTSNKEGNTLRSAGDEEYVNRVIDKINKAGLNNVDDYKLENEQSQPPPPKDDNDDEQESKRNDEQQQQQQQFWEDENDNKEDGRPKKEYTELEEDSRASSSSEEDIYFQDENTPIADWDYYPKKPQSVKEPLLDNFDDNFDYSKDCPSFMNQLDTSPPPPKEPTHTACEGYDGVLHIDRYDYGGASGTAFFEFNIGMLQWADQHNYLPWIHLNDYTWPIWDENVHGQHASTNISFTMKDGMEIEWARDKRDKTYHIFPGRPVQTRELTSKQYHVDGTGVWLHYFEPPTDFVPGDESCKDKPLIKFENEHIVPGIHEYAPWSPRAWRHTDAPYIVRDDLTWDDWFAPQRLHASETVTRYIRFNPMMERRAVCSLPDPEYSLGMHIRHGDKYIERKVIKTSKFLRYAQAFVENGGGAIYVASDSAKVFEKIEKTWPKNVSSHVVRQPCIGLTNNETASFDLGHSAHRTNTEALTDLLALSKCTFFVHGLSALSEAVLYMNPGLIERSINLEDRNHKYKNVDYFVNEIMPKGKKEGIA